MRMRMAEAILKGIGAAIEKEKGQHKVIFDMVKVKCEHRTVTGGVGEPEVCVCDKIIQFRDPCCMEYCPYVNGEV